MFVMENKKQLPSLLPQLAKIAALLLLFLLAPLVPSSLRTPYLYLLFNALVVTLGVESGFLAAISDPRDDRKPSPEAAPLSSSTAAMASRTKPSDSHAAAVAAAHLVTRTTSATNTPTLPSSPNKVPAGAVLTKDVIAPATKTTTKKIKKCPSRASIFFIGSVEDVDTTVHEEEEEGSKDAGELMSRQELFTKAEDFIGNFYKQLKMQREESWKKLQDLYYHHHHYHL
ncbi:hypothetical protein ACP70R_037483 [Stipagrostis hirtigluma subsp. patula]